MVIGEHVGLMFCLFHSKVITNIQVANLEVKHLQENIMLTNNTKEEKRKFNSVKMFSFLQLNLTLLLYPRSLQIVDFPALPKGLSCLCKAGPF